MSEKRTLSTVHAEYSNLCARAGHVNYQIFIHKADLALINEQLRDLSLEAAKLQKEADEAKAKEASNA